MNRNLFALLSALVFASPASAIMGAQVTVTLAPAGPGTHWVSPVAGVFSSVGSERIATLGSPALTALSTLDASARYPFAASPRVLDLLAKNLQFYATPEAFAAMPTEDKLIALSAAAKGAQIEAAAIADKSLAEAKNPLHPGTADAVSKQVAQAAAVAPYLDAQRREDVASMRNKVASFQSKWRKLVKTFNEELPGKIAEGAFDASNILVKTEHGWVAADESPFPVEGDLASFYERRLEALKRAPRGPWSTAEAEVLSGALDRADVSGRELGLTSTLGPTPLWTLRAKEELRGFAYDEVNFRRDLMPAIAAFEKNAQDGSPVAVRFILAVEKRYQDLLNSPSLPGSNRLRLLAAIRNGAGGLPSWKRFQELESSTIARLRLNTMIAAGVMVVGMIAMVLLGAGSAWPIAARFAAVLLAYAMPMIAFARNLWQTGMLEAGRDHSDVAETLRRAFPKD